MRSGARRFVVIGNVEDTKGASPVSLWRAISRRRRRRQKDCAVFPEDTGKFCFVDTCIHTWRLLVTS
jgi:hypothetical protein